MSENETAVGESEGKGEGGGMSADVALDVLHEALQELFRSWDAYRCGTHFARTSGRFTSVLPGYLLCEPGGKVERVGEGVPVFLLRQYVFLVPGGVVGVDAAGYFIVRFADVMAVVERVEAE